MKWVGNFDFKKQIINWQNRIRIAKANWVGYLKDGKGTLSTASSILKDTNYMYKTRFEDGAAGTNPEELLVAAHAGFFTMAVVAMLSKKL